MDYKAMSVEELETRQAEIRAEIDSLETIEEVNARSEEFDAIKAELEKRASIASKKAEIRESIASGEGEVIKTMKVEERKMENTVEVRNSKEYINAFANYIKTGKDEECRALLSGNVSGGTVPVPSIVEERVRTAWEKSDIMSLVRTTNMKGNVKVGFELSATGADVHVEGSAAPTEEELVLGVVEMVPKSIKKWITVSDEAMDLSGEEFVRYIYDELTYRIAKKCADLLVDMIATAHATATATAVGVPSVTANSIAQGTIADALAHLSDEATNPVIIMNKLSYSAFKGVQYAGNYATDIFENLTVLFNDSIKAFSAASAGEVYAIVGDLGVGAQANLPNGEDIKITVDELSLAEKDLVKFVGRKFVGLGLVADKAFVTIKK